MTPQPPAPRPRRGLGMLITGLVLLLLLAPLAVVGGSWFAADRAVGILGSGASVTAQDRTHLRGGRSIDVRLAHGAVEPGDTCTVSGPTGQVDFTPYTASSAPTAGATGAGATSTSRTSLTIGTFHTDAEGEYQVVCPGHERVELTDTLEQVKGVFTGVGGMFAAFAVGGLLGLLGLILLIVGIVRLTSKPRPVAPVPGTVRYR